MSTDEKDVIRKVYSSRAQTYDDSWHVDLAEDFIKWLDPKPGECALDLACGTGLVTKLLASSVGKTGRVTGVDLTNEMLDVARQKDITPNSAEIDWIAADITSETLLEMPSIQTVLEQYGGFDIISICSAFVLLPDQPAALRFWVEKLLKAGGRIIIDVPTEAITLQLLLGYYLPEALGHSTSLAKGRLWVEGKHSLENLLGSNNLEVLLNLQTKSYSGDSWYEADPEKSLYILREKLTITHQWGTRNNELEEAEMVWPKLWKFALVERGDGNKAVYDGNQLYVCVASKRA